MNALEDATKRTLYVGNFKKARLTPVKIYNNKLPYIFIDRINFNNKSNKAILKLLNSNYV